MRPTVPLLPSSNTNPPCDLSYDEFVKVRLVPRPATVRLLTPLGPQMMMSKYAVSRVHTVHKLTHPSLAGNPPSQTPETNAPLLLLRARPGPGSTVATHPRTTLAPTAAASRDCLMQSPGTLSE